MDDKPTNAKNPFWRPQKATKKKKTNQQPSPAVMLILSAVVGFMAATVAFQLSPELVTNTDTITERVILGEGDLIADIVEEVAPSVVSITVTSVEPTFNPFFGTTDQELEGAGTGIILTSDGLIVTNEHVIPDSTTTVTVVLNDGTVYEDVEVVGREPFNDIAYLRIRNVNDLRPAKLGDSDTVRVGEQVIAIGNALGEFETTVTSGIISGKGRPIVAGTGQDSELLTNLFQTDTAINPGNSGGPLLSINGEVIGINTAIAGNAQNIGFAIPINDVKPGITSLEQNGELIRPYLGVRYISLDPAVAAELGVEVDEGAYIFSEGAESAILPDSPASKAGLQNNDVILEVNGNIINDDNPLPNVIGRYQVGETLTLKVLRDGQEIEVPITLEQVPDSL